MNEVILIILFYAALYDFRECKIPNHAVLLIILISLIQALILAFGANSFNHTFLLDSLSGLFIGLTICIALYALNIFGAGDAKLLASLGTAVGFPNIILLIAVSIGFSGAMALFKLACHGELKPMLIRWYYSFQLGSYQRPIENSVAASGVPMGGAILLATMYCEFYLF